MDFRKSDLAGFPSYKAIEWSNHQNVCSIIANDNSLHFLNSYGGEIKIPGFHIRGKVTSIAWSVLSDTLAIGLSDGNLLLYQDEVLKLLDQYHKSSITLLSWDPNSDVFVSAEENGKVCCWSVLANHNVTLLFQNALDTKFVKAVWQPSSIISILLVDDDNKIYKFEQSSDKIYEITTLSAKVIEFTVTPCDKLICITGDNILSTYATPMTEKPTTEIQLPAGQIITLTHIDKDIYAYSANSVITIWSLNSEDIYNIRFQAETKVVGMHYYQNTSQLIAVLSNGNIAVIESTMKNPLRKDGWKPPVLSSFDLNFASATFSGAYKTAALTCEGRRPVIVSLTELLCAVSEHLIAYESEANSVTIGGPPQRCALGVTSLMISNNFVVVNSPSQLDIFTNSGDSLIPFARFSPLTDFIAVNNEAVYTISKTQMEVRNVQGVVKKTIEIGANSNVEYMCVNPPSLVVITKEKECIVYDISRRAPKVKFNTQINLPFENWRITKVHTSNSGFCLAFTCEKYENGIWQCVPDLFLHSPQFDKTAAVTFDSSRISALFWDPDDVRLLCVQTIPFSPDFKASSKSAVFPMFVSDTIEAHRQAQMNLADDEKLVGLRIPNIYIRKGKDKPAARVIPQFDGVDESDETSRKAMMELNYHLATGNIDEAFNSIRGSENKAVWRSLAQISAQAHRIDLASMCFGKMENATSLLLKMAENDHVKSEAIIQVALGLIDEAKAAATKADRYDILTQLLLAVGEKKDALMNSTVRDRIHLKAVTYQAGRSAEIRGDLEEAIKMYEQAGVLPKELGRLAWQFQTPAVVFDYISKHTESEIHPAISKWAGSFFESQGKLEKALEVYERSGNTSECVRLLCLLCRWKEAEKKATASNKRAVMCLYARYLIQRIKNIEHGDADSSNADAGQLKHEVIDMFRKARQFAPALDFAMHNGMIDQVLQLSYSAPAPIVIRAGQWFEAMKQPKNAILMYSRAGRMARALQLCFELKQYDALDEISDSLNSKTDSRVLMQCSHYFAESQRWSKAAQCLAFARRFDDVMELCNTHNIKLKPNVLEELTELNMEQNVTERLAALCEQQGQFTIASKLYIKMKQHLSAVKAMIRGGDTDRVVKIATIMKKREGFILVANYLQTLSPRYDTPYFNTIVSFYQRAQALDKLSRWYEASGQTEIEEYQDYEKGLMLIQMALDTMKEAEAKNKDKIIEALSLKVRWIRMFLDATEAVEKDTKYTMGLCVELLKTKGIDTCLRPDDIYILLVQCYVVKKNFKSAYKILKDLQDNGTEIEYLLDVDVIKAIFKAVGQEYVGPEKDDDGYDSVEDGSDIDIEDVEI